MSDFAQGLENLSIGTTSYTVSLGATFAAAPDVVLVTVRNASSDDPISHINASVLGSTTTQFTVELDAAPESDNYQLAWIAGNADIVFQAVTTLSGVRASQLGHIGRKLKKTDFVIGVADNKTVRVLISRFAELFMGKRTTPPSAPTAAGTAGELSWDNDYLYLHTGVKWLRFARTGDPGDWLLNAKNSVPATQAGVKTIGVGVQVVTVTYARAFSGDPPLVNFTLENLVDATPAGLSGTITERTNAGFKVYLSSATATANYKLVWTATQISI